MTELPKLTIGRTLAALQDRFEMTPEQMADFMGRDRNEMEDLTFWFGHPSEEFLECFHETFRVEAAK